MPPEMIVDNLGIIGALAASAWILFALFSALADATVGYIDEWLLKNLRTGPDIDAPGKLVLISGFFGFVVSLVALLVITVSDSYTLNVAVSSYGYAVAAGVLEVMWLIPYFYALNRDGAINTTPLFQTIPIFSLLLGLIFFGEIPVATHIAAVILIILGACLLNYSRDLKRMNVRAIQLMLVSSAIISLGFFFFKDASITGSFPTAVLGNGLGMALASTVIWTFWPPYRRQFRDFIKNVRMKVFVAQLSNEGLYTIGAVSNQLAIVLGPSVMVVSAFNAFHPIFTLLIGIVLAKRGSQDHIQAFNESSLLTKTIAIFLIATGTIVIAL